MSSNRISVLLSILKGFIACIAVTLAGMLLITLLTVFARIPDSAITALNQLLKIAAIVLGTRAAVGRGGSRGFVTGTVVALLYMIMGYAMYVWLGGGAHTATLMLGEMLIGAAIGGIVGAILANLQPKPRKKHRAASAARS